MDYLQSSVFVIVCRSQSNRLPNKCYLPIFNNLSVLEVLLSRLSRYIPNSRIIVATTSSPSDDKICEIATDLSIPFYRGSSINVLDRIINAALLIDSSVQHIIRITADNPLTDPFHTLAALDHHYHYQSDYTDMPTVPVGCKSEIISYEFASFLLKSIEDLSLTEYLTFFLRQDIGQKIEHYTGSISVPNTLNFTLDTQADYDYLLSLFSLFSSPFTTLSTILRILESSSLSKHENMHDSNNAIALLQNDFFIKANFESKSL